MNYTLTHDIVRYLQRAGLYLRLFNLNNRRCRSKTCDFRTKIVRHVRAAICLSRFSATLSVLPKVLRRWEATRSRPGIGFLHSHTAPFPLLPALCVADLYCIKFSWLRTRRRGCRNCLTLAGIDSLPRSLDQMTPRPGR